MRVAAGVCTSVIIKSNQRFVAARIAGARRGQHQEFAGGVTERAIVGGQRLQPAARLLVGVRVDEQRPGAQRGQVLQHRADRAVSGDLVVGRDGGLGIGLGELGCFAQAREMAITGGAVGGDLAERCLGLAALAGLGQRTGRLEGRAGLGGFPGLPPRVAAPGGNPDDHEDERRDDKVAVPVPQLLELFPANFLVNFLENIGHGTFQPTDAPRAPAPTSAGYPIDVALARQSDPRGPLLSH